jgi:hypothetical protein
VADGPTTLGVAAEERRATLAKAACAALGWGLLMGARLGVKLSAEKGMEGGFKVTSPRSPDARDGSQPPTTCGSIVTIVLSSLPDLGRSD